MIFDLNILLILCHMNLGMPAFDYQEGQVRGCKSGVHDIYSNIVTAVDTVSADDITRTQGFYGAVPFSWRVSVDDHATQQLLSDLGFKEQQRWQAMGIELKDISEAQYAQNVRVEEVSPEAQDFLDAYTAAASEYELDIESIKTWYSYLLERAGKERVHCYVAYYQDKPVGVSTLVDHGSIAVQSDCGIAPDHRGKGCGYAVTHKPLNDAKQRGVQEAWCFSVPTDREFSKKFGFKEYADYVLYAK